MIAANTIDTKELKQCTDDKKDFVLIDLLPANSYETHHIPGAAHADFRSPDFMSKVAKLVPDKSKEIVLYCMSFNCTLSMAAARRLAAAGYANVAVQDGGLAGWQDNGFAFEGAEAQSKVPETCDDCQDCGCS